MFSIALLQHNALTLCCPNTLSKAFALPQLYEHIRAELRDGGRVYIVCPLVEASSVAAFSEMKAAEVEYERLQVCPCGRTLAGEQNNAAALGAFDGGGHVVTIALSSRW